MERVSEKNGNQKPNALVKKKTSRRGWERLGLKKKSRDNSKG